MNHNVMEENKLVQNHSKSMEVKRGKSGPMRARTVGRTPKDQIPLYEQPEPENILEKRKWRRAVTAYEHRLNKKTELAKNTQKIEELMKELQNQLKVVTAERDAFKSTLDSLGGNALILR